MLSVYGIYDGKSVKFTERITEKKKFRVLVTFIEEIEKNENELRDFSSQLSGLDFWDVSKEDIYQDYVIPKSKEK